MVPLSPSRWSVARLAIAWLVCSSPPLLAQPDGSTVDVSNRSELVAAVAQAQPGTRIRLAPGEYRGSLMFIDLHGEPARPITLEARDPQQPPVIVGGASGIHLRRPAYVELRHVVLRGATDNGLNIDDGGQAGGTAHHLVLQGLQIRDVGTKGNHDGIKLSGVDQFRIDGCTLERWGESGSAIDMVGCHQGEIKACTFRYRDDLAANGVQAKGGTADIRVSRCRFEHTGGRGINIGGSTGRDYFRPRDANYEARHITVEDCTFLGSMSPIAFVGVDGAVVRYNTIYRPTRWIIRILQETQGPEFIPCRNGEFSHNLVVFRSDEVRTPVNIGGGTAPETFRFAHNHWYCLDQPPRSDRLGLPTPETSGHYGIDPQFRDAEQGDLRLQNTSPVQNAGVRDTGEATN